MCTAVAVYEPIIYGFPQSYWLSNESSSNLIYQQIKKEV